MSRAGTTVARRRGEPALALAAVIGCWVLARGVLLALPGEAPASAATLSAEPLVSASSQALPLEPASLSPSTPGMAPLTVSSPAPPVIFDQPAPLPSRQADPLPSIATPAPDISVPEIPASDPSFLPTARVAASHQLLYLAAFAQLPFPPEVLVARPDLAAPVQSQPWQSRWSADGWLLWRQDSGALLVGGFAPASYGASQAGAVLRYRLSPDSRYQPLAYLRVTSALNSPSQPEAAFGFGARPVPRLPVTMLAELRVSQSGGQTRVRPAVAIVGGLPRQRLPLGFGIEGYGQAGYVAGPDASGFVDGQARLDRRIVRLGSSELRGGGAIWGGAQRGAGRLDVGPSASVELRLGQSSARLSADWRFRVAGQAAPASGPAVTLSAGF